MSASDEALWLSSACTEKTRSDLEWDRLLQAIADRSPGPLGKRAALALPFASTRDGVHEALEETREACALLASGDPLPDGATSVVSSSIDRVRAGGVLGPVELRDIARLLSYARILRRYLHVHRDRSPRLFEACMTDPHLDPVEREIAEAFDDDGSLSDRASDRLRELRGERQAARARLIRKLEDVMQRYEATLQDSFFTEREGRFVLPVRSDSHERFTGIVHGTSLSGQTLFMEPRGIIPLGNRLKVIDADIDREQNAVYARLTASLTDVIASIADAERALAHAELRAACARLAVDLRLTFPEVVDEPSLDLIAARHPLLELDGVVVVPSDVRVTAAHALVISGPNAGGKTVVLKTLGLCALMLRAGLPLPCKADSRVGIFETVATDVGDEQSIAKNLSTFSAHVTNLVSILNAASRGVLVLVDELATGTDPRQGEALASSVLDSLCSRGAAVACTTHYEGLKALALGDARFQNASVGFDLPTISPTFKLLMGIPGTSSALAIARRFGMPSLVIDRAERFLGTEDRNFEDLVRKLNDERRALELARASVERESAELVATQKKLQGELLDLRARERKLISKETESLLGAVRRAREELRSAEQRLRSRKLDEPRLREASKIIERVASKVAVGGELEPPQTAGKMEHATPVDGAKLHKGMRVYVPRIRAEAQVLDWNSDGQVRVVAGAVKLTVSQYELRSADVAEPAGQASRSERRAAVTFDAASDPEQPIQTSDNRCDLRGLRVDEAVMMAEQFLDRALNDGRRVAFLIHGHGTGALRDAVRDLLRTSLYVLRFRAGEPSEGGDGVTVVWLK